MSVEKTKKYLTRALQELPNKQSFSEAKTLLNRALRSIEKSEVKKSQNPKSENLNSQWKFDIEQGMMMGPSSNPKAAIEELDKMMDSIESQIKD